MQTKRKANRRRSSFLSRRGRIVGQPLDRRLRIEPLEDRRMLAVITVDSFLDNFDPGAPTTDGLITLREAILAANTDAVVGDAPAGSGADTIEFDGALSGQTISLGAELVITEALTIDASSLTAGIMIDAGNGADNTFNTGDGFRIFNIDDGVNFDEIDVELVGLTLTGGDVSGDGGAIFSLENLTIISSTITGNSVTGTFANGGGIGFRYGTTTITSSTISGNSAENRGGGISMLGTSSGASTITLTITSSTISGNSAGSIGGGIHALFDIMTITSSTISGNSAGADGGGILASSGTTTITSSTITGNWANADNIGTDSGGGIEIAVGIISTTSLTLSHTLVAGNGLGNPGNTDDDISGFVETASDFNLIGVDTGLTGITNGINGNQIGTSASPINPLLGPLADNGGPTQTHALLAGSPTIDAGDPGFATPPDFDQRGAPFVRASGTIDIGAYERQTVASLNLVVDTSVDENDGDYSAGDLSLREAVGLANGSVGADTITFDATVFATPQTILLSRGEIEITEALTIDTTALANNVTIDAQQDSRIFNITATSGDFTLAGLTLTGGRTIGNNINAPDTTYSGGAVRSNTTGNLTIDQTTVSNNSTMGNYAEGGGIRARGAVTITSSTISANSTAGQSSKGGGIHSSGPVTLTNSTVSGNSTAGLFANGGGIYSFGVSMLTNSTVSGNSTTGNFASGGGMITFGDTTLASSTVSDNHANGNDTYGGGIWNNNDVMNISNSIVAGNTATADMNDIRPGTGPLASFSVNYSLIGTGVTPDAGTSGNNVVTNSPLIGPLADNGGPTETHALLVGSPAIDAGDPAIVSPPPTYDQRGAPFVRVFDDPVALGSGIDIGAFELQPITDSADFDGDNDVDGADFLAWQRGFGTSNPTTADGDADNDNDVDGDDLGIWEGQFGQTAPVEYGVSAASIHFFNGLVTDLWVLVAPEWLETDQVWLEIEITGINDGFHHHGFQVGLVSDTTLLAEDQGDALVRVDWTTDTNITHSPEDYTACIQAIVGGQPFGAENCRTFGPFLQAALQAPVLSQRAELVDLALAFAIQDRTDLVQQAKTSLANSMVESEPEVEAPRRRDDVRGPSRVADNDLDADSSDLGVWESQFGQPAPAVSATSSPVIETFLAVEPSTAFQVEVTAALTSTPEESVASRLPENFIVSPSDLGLGFRFTVPRQVLVRARAFTEHAFTEHVDKAFHSVWNSLPEQHLEIASDDFVRAKHGHSVKATRPADEAFAELADGIGFAGLRPSL